VNSNAVSPANKSKKKKIKVKLKIKEEPEQLIEEVEKNINKEKLKE